MANPKRKLHLFEGYGVEMEYMIVHRQDLHVLPICDKLIFDEVGAYLSDVEFGDIAWSNELVLHVVELKTQGPVESLTKLHLKFQEHVQKINNMLAKYEAMLLPTGAHPLMNPYTDTKLWPHEHNAIYEAYNRIFDCRGHGWANLQSTHLNLPFQGDEEFGKLHAAIRMVLPILPALSASTPILDGKITGLADTRLEVYRHNQKAIPSIAGKVVPEAVFTKAAYEKQILQKMYAAIADKDPEGELQEEFLNSRGAIARFERNAIEIRVLDLQECPLADVAVLQAIVAVLQALVSERWAKLEELMAFDEDRLAAILLDVIREGGEASLQDQDFLRMFGAETNQTVTASMLWKHLVKETKGFYDGPEEANALQVILDHGNLSKRITKATGASPTQLSIKKVYQRLAECLQQGKMFIPVTTC
ncbi:carboxylate-amine ligase [Pontibacter akesuensis]|uniref:Glutamate-cysteine ligase family 2(GCS2) n=1 Tax=Pontibacter akesuensis TaxID=388950 RepID=A0A1I7FZB4_9BACT|nr:glutamate-cysteine ligase family protein [Pontibacter akesuensis]GHA59805.1 glutamate--cysteine ligase [Pontibacter akesuensis]SFU41421.1 Glutamate-cysteine ligase family 2(GCS2) [Pontibacter akesuensis]